MIRFLIVLVVMLSLFSGCVSYRRCAERFGSKTYADTTYVENVVYMPKDSVELRMVTDTTTIYRVVESKNARIIYDRTNTVTKVIAECDADTVYIKTPYKVEVKTVFEPQKKWYSGLWWILVLIGVLMLLVFLQRFIK